MLSIMALFVVMLNSITIIGIVVLSQMADEHGKRDVGRTVTALETRIVADHGIAMSHGTEAMGVD